jgi:GrpB-like predicted nucleotidyltransferase (UPF0157 family)
VLTAAEIVTFADAPPPPGESPWVSGSESAERVSILAADPTWADTYRGIARTVREALGTTAISIEHIGSTSVPGLDAKPIIDIDVIVRDPGDEQRYVPALERCGFDLIVREPWWYQHRCFRLAHPACNLHVFPVDCPESARHAIFRDWLRSHPDDRALYAETKRDAAAATTAAQGRTMDYNARKQAVVREIYGRAFRGLGLID